MCVFNSCDSQEDFEFHGQAHFQDPRSASESTTPMEGENMGGWWPEYSTPDTGVRAARQFSLACTCSSAHVGGLSCLWVRWLTVFTITPPHVLSSSGGWFRWVLSSNLPILWMSRGLCALDYCFLGSIGISSLFSACGLQTATCRKWCSYTAEEKSL